MEASYLEHFFLYFLTGAFAGTLSGLLGIGGGVIVVPALMLVFLHLGLSHAIVMHVAAGTSLAAMVVTTASSFFAHRGRGVEITPIFKRLFPAVLFGVVSGAILADFIHSHVLRIIFGVFVFFIGLRQIFLIEVPTHRKLPGSLGMNGMGLLIGVKSGLLGIGGGVITIPFLTYCNVPMRQAIGVATLISFTIAVTGTISLSITGMNETGLPPYSWGYIYWPAVLGIVCASPFFARFGAYLSHRVHVMKLKRVFGVLLLLTGLHMLY